MSDRAGKSPVSTFVIGDVHGHIERLEALLQKVGATDEGVTVIQLGDLGHFGADTQGGDTACWQAAKDGLVDMVLWGNHDRAVVDSTHRFVGYTAPAPEIKHIMRLMEAEGRLKMAEEAHGWLITHAGLHSAIEFQDVFEMEPDLRDARALADWLSSNAGDTHPVIDAVSRERGGWSPHGGVLWRDVNEPLWGGVPQIFGHSASSRHEVRGESDLWYCIDIGGKGGYADPDANCLAGIWLPSQEIVRIDKDEL